MGYQDYTAALDAYLDGNYDEPDPPDTAADPERCPGSDVLVWDEEVTDDDGGRYASQAFCVACDEWVNAYHDGPAGWRKRPHNR